MSVQTIHKSDHIQDTFTIVNTKIDECTNQVLAIQSILKTEINRTFNELCKQVKQGNTLDQCLPLLNKVTDFDQANKYGITLLMFAVRYGKEDLQLALLERTTNVNQVDRDLKDSLTYSLEYKVSLLVILELIKKAKITRNHINLAIKNDHDILVYNALNNKLVNQD